MTGTASTTCSLREADCSVAMASGPQPRATSPRSCRRQRLRPHAGGGRRGSQVHQQPAAVGVPVSREDRVHRRARPGLHRDAALPCSSRIQMSLLSTAAIGIPSFVLALEPNHELVRGSFLANVLARSLPARRPSWLRSSPSSAGRALGHPSTRSRRSAPCSGRLVGVALVWRISQLSRRCAWPCSPLSSPLLRVDVRLAAPFFEHRGSDG